MMNFMEFIQGFALMEKTMSPIEEEVFQEVNDKQLTKKLPETWKLCKPLLYSKRCCSINY